MNNYVVIIADGIGNHLKPMKIPEYPKQFIYVMEYANLLYSLLYRNLVI